MIKAGIYIYYAKYYDKGGGWSAGETNKNEELGEKNEKGERKKDKNYI